MVEIQKISKKFYLKRAGFFEKPLSIKALDDVSFQIKRGEILGLVGESGSGKSTMAKTILRLLEPDSGRVVINNEDVTALRGVQLRQFRKHMQMVFQDPQSSLNPRMTVRKIVTEPLYIHSAMKKNEIEDRFRQIMDMVGLSDDSYARYPHEFSGGQRQRIGIARAIALDPSLLILDEPVSALDVSIQGQILNLLKELQMRLNLTVLFISHDLAAVEYMSNRIIVMYLGKIVEQNTKEGLYQNPLHPYTRSLMQSIPEARPVKHAFSVVNGEIPSPEAPPVGCYFHPRCPQAMDICRRLYPESRSLHSAIVSCHLYNA